MSEPSWYYAQNEEQHGPVTFEQLQELVESGQVSANDLVWNPDLPDWKPAGSVKGLAPEGAVQPPTLPKGGGAAAGREWLDKGWAMAQSTSQLPNIRLIQALVDGLRRLISAATLDKVDGGAKTVGTIGYLLGGALYVLVAIVAAFKADTDQLQTFFWALLVILPLLVVGHYIAYRFLNVAKGLLERSPSRLFSRAFLDCFGLIGLGGALLSALWGIYAAFQGDQFSFSSLGIGLGGAIVLLYLSAAALNPESLNVEVGEKATAGEEAVGILSFLFKLPLRLVPFVYCVSAVVAAVTTILALVYLLGDDYFPYVGMEATSRSSFITAAVFPFAAYLGYLLLNLWIQLIRSVLVLPELLGGGKAEG